MDPRELLVGDRISIIVPSINDPFVAPDMYKNIPILCIGEVISTEIKNIKNTSILSINVKFVYILYYTMDDNIRLRNIKFNEELVYNVHSIDLNDENLYRFNETDLEYCKIKYKEKAREYVISKYPKIDKYIKYDELQSGW